MGSVPSVTVPYTVARTLRAGGKDQIDVLLLETLDLEAAAVRQTIEVLQGVSHWMITS